ncbi:helix-turn-helix transcriptional regulator [Agrilutibacter niabensis]|uniref:helix-turn-helix transcriptional regulator n=1 Tax=Agrilutibacter niabensis TaxID=380628 RepID=UPI00286AD91F|nr:AlpA family phage regulatory protein [Lysobacter niabensis]
MFLRLPEVLRRCGLSRSALYRAMRATPPQFPQPYKLSLRASGWAEHEVDAWCEAKLAGGAK